MNQGTHDRADTVDEREAITAITVAPTRRACPCCGYATLPARNAHNVCRLCNWEDDGQGDDDADEVRHGPNADYSLSRARANFLRYRVMYAPGPDRRLQGAASQFEFDTKGQLMAALEHLQRCPPNEVERTLLEVAGLEWALHEEARRRVLEYDRARIAVRRGVVPLRRWMHSLLKLVLVVRAK